MVMVGRMGDTAGHSQDSPCLVTGGNLGMWVVLFGSSHWTHLCQPPRGRSRDPAGMALAKSSSVWCCLGRKGRKEEKVIEAGSEIPWNAGVGGF